MTTSRLTAAVAVLALSCGGRQTMQVDRIPVAEFKFTQSTVRQQVFVFDAAQSRATVGTLAKYKWLFGDEPGGAAPTELASPTAQHAYKTAGMFTVTLVVADDKDTNSEAVSKMVMVASVNTEGPMAKITGPSTGQPAMMLTFDGSTSTPTGDIQNFVWDFGDGQTTSGKDKTIVQHAFATANRFRVTLTVTDSLGQSNTAELQVAVGDVGPLAVCTWSPMPPIQGSPVMFSGAMSTVPAGSNVFLYLWDFGDGVNNVPGAMPGGAAQHTYTGAGPFTAKLKVIDDHQPSRTHETTCPQITLVAPPICAFDYTMMASNQPSCLGQPTAFSGSRITLTQMSGSNQMTGREMVGTQAVNYTGTYTGSMFTLMGSLQDSQGLDHDITINGTFAGACATWSGTYREVVSEATLGTLCTLTYQITGTKL